MGIDKAPLMEKFMDGKGRFAAHTESGVEQVGARAQMGDGAEIFHRMTLFLQGIIGGALPFHPQAFHLDFNGLIALGLGDSALNFHRSTHRQSPAHVINRLAAGADQLNVLYHRAVVEFHKGAGLHIPHRAHPALEMHLFPQMLLGMMQ